MERPDGSAAPARARPVRRGPCDRGADARLNLGAMRRARRSELDSPFPPTDQGTTMSDMPDFSNVQSGSSSTATKIHEVKPGDSLSKIAKHEYGDANKWPVIFEANKDILKDPNKIYPGQQLKIPPLG
jgi:nucleoid-associated protein YgaU